MHREGKPFVQGCVACKHSRLDPSSLCSCWLSLLPSGKACGLTRGRCETKALVDGVKGSRPTFVATWMDLESVILNEVSQTEKEKYGIPYMWNLKKKKKKHEPTKQKETHTLRK